MINVEMEKTFYKDGKEDDWFMYNEDFSDMEEFCVWLGDEFPELENKTLKDFKRDEFDWFEIMFKTQVRNFTSDKEKPQWEEVDIKLSCFFNFSESLDIEHYFKTKEERPKRYV